jgi:hypothetical protein
MTRVNSDTWHCVICGYECQGGVVCRECEYAEMNRQKLKPGSITAQQIWYIEKKLLTKLESDITAKIIFEIIPEYDYDMEELSCQQGKDLIAKLIQCVETMN